MFYDTYFYFFSLPAVGFSWYFLAGFEVVEVVAVLDAAGLIYNKDGNSGAGIWGVGGFATDFLKSVQLGVFGLDAYLHVCFTDCGTGSFWSDFDDY